MLSLETPPEGSPVRTSLRWCFSLLIELPLLLRYDAKEIRFSSQLELYRLGAGFQLLQIHILHPLIFIGGPVEAFGFRAHHRGVDSIVIRDDLDVVLGEMTLLADPNHSIREGSALEQVHHPDLSRQIF